LICICFCWLQEHHWALGCLQGPCKRKYAYVCKVLANNPEIAAWCWSQIKWGLAENSVCGLENTCLCSLFCSVSGFRTCWGCARVCSVFGVRLTFCCVWCSGQMLCRVRCSDLVMIYHDESLRIIDNVSSCYIVMMHHDDISSWYIVMVYQDDIGWWHSMMISHNNISWCYIMIYHDGSIGHVSVLYLCSWSDVGMFVRVLVFGQRYVLFVHNWIRVERLFVFRQRCLLPALFSQLVGRCWSLFD